METPSEQIRVASEADIRTLEEIAVGELKAAGCKNLTAQAILPRVRTLAEKRGLILPGAPGHAQSPSGSRAKKTPDYLGADLEQKAQQCAIRRRHARLQKHIRIVRENTDRFYLLCFLQGGFARELRKSRALEVFTAVIERAGGDVETWVSIAALGARLGRTAKTVCKALRALEAKKIVSLIDAGTVDFSLNGRPVTKKQGYVIRIHAPMLWDWEPVGGVPETLKKYLADYEDEPVDNSADPGNSYAGTPVTVTTDL